MYLSMEDEDVEECIKQKNLVESSKTGFGGEGEGKREKGVKRRNHLVDSMCSSNTCKSRDFLPSS